MDSINKLICLVVISVLLIFSECASVPKSVLFQEHLARIEAFRCGNPQPRLVHHSKFINATGKVDPDCTVLYKCDESACSCSGNSSCLPDEVEPVTLYFREMVGKGRRYHPVETVNHIRCSCQENTPK